MKRSARRTAESGPPEGNHHGTGGGMVTPVSPGTAAAADVPGAAAEAIEDGDLFGLFLLLGHIELLCTD